MDSIVMTGPAQAQTIIPSGTPVQPGQPLPPGTTVDIGYQESPSGWNPAAATSFITVMGAVQKQAGSLGINLGVFKDIPYQQLAEAIAMGAAMGGAVGAVVAVFIVLVTNWSAMFGGNSPDTYETPFVKAWKTNFAPQEYIDHMIATYEKPHFSTVAAMAAGVLLFWEEKYGAVLVDGQGTAFSSNGPDDIYIASLDWTNGPTPFSPPILGQNGPALARELYRNTAVAYDATKQKRAEKGKQSDHKFVVMYKAKILAPGSNPTSIKDPDTPPKQGGGKLLAIGAGVIGAGWLINEATKRKKNPRTQNSTF